MAKRDLRQYLQELDRQHLEEQILDLYSRFKPVKVYYDFVFNPNEEAWVEECKVKIGKEYFPPSGRKPKARRSVAQKYIRHFQTIGMEPLQLAEVMVFNLEVAQEYSDDKKIRQEAFFKSMLKSYDEAVDYCRENDILGHYHQRLTAIARTAVVQEWPNAEDFTHRNLTVPQS